MQPVERMPIWLVFLFVLTLVFNTTAFAQTTGDGSALLTAHSPLRGATVVNLSRELATYLGLDLQAEGVVITDVAEGSSAQAVGFQKGDVVVSVNNEKITKPADLERVTAAGGPWRITALRGGQQISATFIEDEQKSAQEQTDEEKAQRDNAPTQPPPSQLVPPLSPPMSPRQELPQTQMAAAALMMGQVVFPGWRAVASIQIIDDKTAQLRGALPGHGMNLNDVVDVTKIDDCHFEATQHSSSSKLATIDLSVLGNEYRQWPAQYIPGGVYTEIIGTGKKPAICSRVTSLNYSSSTCFNNLILGLGGVESSTVEQGWRALKAVNFLQKNCPPSPHGL
jgi:hypothetical protein